jgi:hypothetical protein
MPTLHTITNDSIRDYRNSSIKRSPYITIWYNTYAELKKNLKKHLDECTEDELYIYRTRRGEWGEWFERWSLSDKGKPYIIKEGWM